MKIQLSESYLTYRHMQEEEQAFLENMKPGLQHTQM